MRGAARLKGGRRLVWGSSYCAGLLDCGREEAASGGAAAVRGCTIEGEKRLLLEELPLRGAASLREGGGCFCGVLQLRGAARLR